MLDRRLRVQDLTHLRMIILCLMSLSQMMMKKSFWPKMILCSVRKRLPRDQSGRRANQKHWNGLGILGRHQEIFWRFFKMYIIMAYDLPTWTLCQHMCQHILELLLGHLAQSHVGNFVLFVDILAVILAHDVVPDFVPAVARLFIMTLVVKSLSVDFFVTRGLRLCPVHEKDKDG